MAQPALKLTEYGEKLSAYTCELSEFEIRRMLMELERATKTLSGPDLASTYSLMGMAYDRLGKPDRALVEFRKSARIDPTLVHRFNLGRMLLKLDQVEEAVDVLAEAVELDGRDVGGLLRFAEALFRLGSRDDALEIFEQAIAAADFKSLADVLALAVEAAKMGFDGEAVELFARYLALGLGIALGNSPAVTFIEQCDVSARDECFALAPELQRAVERALHFGPDVEHLRMMPRPAEPHISGLVDADETAEDVLAWMAPHRARANAAVLPEGDEDE